MRSVMIDEQQLRRFDVEPATDVVAYPNLVPHPRHHRIGEGSPRPRIALHGGEQDALELHERLLVEHDVVEIRGG